MTFYLEDDAEGSAPVVERLDAAVPSNLTVAGLFVKLGEDCHWLGHPLI